MSDNGDPDFDKMTEAEIAEWQYDHRDELDADEGEPVDIEISPDVRVVRLSALKQIAALHSKHVDKFGGTNGFCIECGFVWPCPTYHLAMGWGAPDECRDHRWCAHVGVKYPDY